MKNYICYLFAVLFLFACKHEEAALFDDLSSVRMEKATNALQTLLISSEDGWRVCYYPDPEVYGAYNFLMKFTQTEVTVQGDELFPSGKHTSFYGKMTTQGPGIVFESYNEAFSRLADPMLYSYGEGLRGDNEFVWLRTSANQDTVVFKAKKLSYPVKFVKHSGEWDEYINKINSNALKYRTGAMDRYFKQLNMEDGSHLVLAGYHPEYRTINSMYFVKQDSIAVFSNAVAATFEGLEFYYPIDMKGKKVKHLIFDESADKFIVNDPGINGEVVGISEPPFVFENSNKEIFQYQMQADAVRYSGVRYTISAYSSELQVIIDNISKKVYEASGGKHYFYGVWFWPSTSAASYDLYFFYLTDEDYYLHSAANISRASYTYSKSTARTDKIRFTSQRTVSISGDYRTLIDGDCRTFLELITNGRTGRDYIVIPNESNTKFTLGSCDNSIYFTLGRN